MRSRIIIAVAPLALLVVTGCFAKKNLPDDQVYWAAITVDSRTSLLGEGTIWLQPRRGVRRRIGTISSDEEKELTVENVVPGTYQLILRLGARRERASPQFYLRNGDAIAWRVDTNHIVYLGQVIVDTNAYPWD